MFPRIELSSSENSPLDGGINLIEKTQTQLNSYAKLGLRVLVMAKKVLKQEEYEVWKESHLEAEVSKKSKKIHVNCFSYRGFIKIKIIAILFPEPFIFPEFTAKPRATTFRLLQSDRVPDEASRGHRNRR